MYGRRAAPGERRKPDKEPERPGGREWARLMADSPVQLAQDAMIAATAPGARPDGGDPQRARLQVL